MSAVDRERLDTLAQIAYEAYRTDRGGPEWPDLMSSERATWRAVVDAVLTYDYMRRPDNPAHSARLPGVTTVASDVTLDRAGATPPGSRRIEPPVMTRAGDRIGFNDRMFRVWRGDELVADYAAGDDGVLRPVQS